LETSLTFDQALAALLGLIGERVDVMVSPVEHPRLCPLVTFNGVLHSGTRAPVPKPHGECFFFSLVGVDVAFWLARERFEGARESRDIGLWLRQGEMEIAVLRSSVFTGEAEA